jgi:ABC-type multidrug transport system fused ATPase/permease subunit
VREVLRFVGLEDAVRQLPHGLQTDLLPHGGPLSESQAIRLGIARALIGKPRLLILDGVLDNLDPGDNPELLDHLFDRSRPWTLLVASNNPKILAMCDRHIGDTELVGGNHR